MEIYISSYCRIKNNSIAVNGSVLPVNSQETAAVFLSEIYKHFELSYPKFHKMDTLCKLGLLGTEAVLKGSEFLTKNQPGNVGIIFSNKSSSLDTDRTYQKSIDDVNNYLPSPSVFVYTLPNIIIGEIAIKHKITGENAFFVTENFNSELLVSQNQLLLKTSENTAIISGWVDYDNGQLDALIYLAEIANDSIKNTNFIPLNKQTLNQLY